jgi:hypothetical protein
MKARPVQQIDAEIEKGILAVLASPQVAVLKSNLEFVRLCAVFKQTVNPVSESDHYPEIVHETLRFTKLDLRNAYQQLPLDEKSQEYCTANTCRGLLQYT